MATISSKKKKFIKRNYKQLSIEELVQKTGLTTKVIRSLVNEYTSETQKKTHASSPKPAMVKDPLHKRILPLLCAVSITLLTVIVYLPALQNQFVWDDFTYVTKNSFIVSLDSTSFYKMLTVFYASNWHPLTWTSHALDYAFWNIDPFGHHLTNIILHGVNTFLVFFLVLQCSSMARNPQDISSTPAIPRLTSSKHLIVAAVTGLLFGIHPLHVESVAWVAERKDLLCAFFVLLSIFSYIIFTSSVTANKRRVWFSICLCFFICALMSKPMAVTLPIVLLLLDIYPLRRFGQFSKGNVSIVWEKIPFLIFSIASAIITIMAQRAGQAIVSFEQWDLGVRLLNALRSLIFYLEKMIVPYKLVPFYPLSQNPHWFDLQYVLSGIVVATITGLCVWLVKQKKYLFCIIWSYYIITLLPVLGIIQVGSQAAADRYTYLPSISIFLLAGIGVMIVFEKSTLTKHKNLFRGLIVICVSATMFLFGQHTIKQIKIWNNSETLWKYVTASFPQKAPHAHYNLGFFYGKRGRFDDAITQFKETLAIDPNHANAHNNLGLAYDGKGMLDEAISEFNKTLAINPRLAEAHNNLGMSFQKQGMLDEAISEYKEALIIEPTMAAAHHNLSATYFYKKNYKLAIAHCDIAEGLGYSIHPTLLDALKPYR
jgi:tetratricopeptide (TPR) repeat protein